jgi:hypothetical protein
LNHHEYDPRKCIGRLDTWDSLHVNNSAFASRVNFNVLGDPAERPNHDSATGSSHEQPLVSRLLVRRGWARTHDHCTKKKVVQIRYR